MNWELPDVQVGRDRGTRDQIAKPPWIIEKAREFQKNIYLTSLTMPNWGKFLKRWEYQTTLPPSWENLCVVQEASVRTGHGTVDLFKIGKGVLEGCILLPVYLTYMRVHHVKCQAGWIPSWKQHCREQYQ